MNRADHTCEITTPAAFTRRRVLNASADRAFAAIATSEGLRGWWTPLVGGTTAAGGDLRFEFEGLDQHIVMHVEASQRPSDVLWTCVRHTALPEWAGTQVSWSFQDQHDGTCELRLAHIGLTASLECFEHCEIGWDRFLASIAAYVERGQGNPYRDDGSGTCSTAKHDA